MNARPDPRTGPGSHQGRDGKPRGLPVRGVRIDGDLWAAAAEKAEGDGTTRNAAIVALLHGYVDGKITLPRQ